MDGTLYDKSRLPLRVVLADLRHIRWLKAEREARKQLKGKDFGSEDAFWEAFFGVASSLAGVSVEKYREWYFGKYMPSMAAVLSRHYRLRPWVKEAFADLRSRGVKTAVFSDYSAVGEKLLALGFDPSWADLVTDAPSLGGLKPSSASFRRVASALGLSPADCLMVGDREDTDGDGARAAGMAFRLLPNDGLFSIEF